MSDNFGIQIFKDDGVTVVWDSRNSGGGVMADFISLPANDASTITRTYPLFAGRSVRLIPTTSFSGVGSVGAVDTDLGYPRFTSRSLSINYARQAIVSVY